MTREETVARALELHTGGYNCAQAVACALAEALGGAVDLDEAQLFAACEEIGRASCRERVFRAV